MNETYPRSTTSKTERQCKDCRSSGISTKRRAPYPGPRCATHHRERKRRVRERAWERHIWEFYRLTPEKYNNIYAAQGGRCYICQRARGTGKKKLSVDHDHSCCPGPKSCGKCVRGLLCTTCNRFIGHLRDCPKAFIRASEYVTNPPAKPFL